MSRDALEKALSAYPIEAALKGRSYTIRVMRTTDGPALMAFARELPAHDRLYMRRDLTSQRGIDSWIRDIEEGSIHSLLAEDEDGVAGFATIHLNHLEWTRHVADIRVATAERTRRSGLGRVLAREVFNVALALDIEKLFARMTPDPMGITTICSSRAAACRPSWLSDRLTASAERSVARSHARPLKRAPHAPI